MKDLDLAAIGAALKKNKYVLLVLCLGLALLLLPRRAASETLTAPAATAAPASPGSALAASGIPLGEECRRIAALLSAVQGVGRAEVLLSSGGCVVVCDGAEQARVRLHVTDAVAAYTGLRSDKIYVLKMQ